MEQVNQNGLLAMVEGALAGLISHYYHVYSYTALHN